MKKNASCCCFFKFARPAVEAGACSYLPCSSSTLQPRASQQKPLSRTPSLPTEQTPSTRVKNRSELHSGFGSIRNNTYKKQKKTISRTTARYSQSLEPDSSSLVVFLFCFVLTRRRLPSDVCLSQRSNAHCAGVRKVAGKAGKCSF